jgi:hypothetical protein
VYHVTVRGIGSGACVSQHLRKLAGQMESDRVVCHRARDTGDEMRRTAATKGRNKGGPRGGR